MTVTKNASRILPCLYVIFKDGKKTSRDLRKIPPADRHIYVQSWRAQPNVKFAFLGNLNQ